MEINILKRFQILLMKIYAEIFKTLFDNYIQAPTAPRITTNVSQTIEEAQESAPTLCQSISLVVFHPDALAFLSSVLTRGAK